MEEITKMTVNITKSRCLYIIHEEFRRFGFVKQFSFTIV